MARTTMPFGGRAAATGTGGGSLRRLTAGDRGFGFALGRCLFFRCSTAASTCPTSGMMPFAAAGVNACATACSRPRPPRPRPPRRRRPRVRVEPPGCGRSRGRRAAVSASDPSIVSDGASGCGSNSGSGGSGSFHFGCGGVRSRAASLFCIKICRLQGWRRRLTRLTPGLSFCVAVSDRASIYACSGL